VESTLEEQKRAIAYVVEYSEQIQIVEKKIQLSQYRSQYHVIGNGSVQARKWKEGNDVDMRIVRSNLPQQM
jgi:recombinational DNA repair protein RecR